jgi:hypothetical protein
MSVILDGFVKVRIRPISSFRRRPESSRFNNFWIEVYPDNVGNQVRDDDQTTFYELIILKKQK